MAQGFIAVVSGSGLHLEVQHVAPNKSEFRLSEFRISEDHYDTYLDALDAADEYAAEVAERLGVVMVSMLSGKVVVPRA